MPLYIQWTIPSLLYQTRSKNPLVYNDLKANSIFTKSFVVHLNSAPAKLSVRTKTDLIISLIHNVCA